MNKQIKARDRLLNIFDNHIAALRNARIVVENLPLNEILVMKIKAMINDPDDQAGRRYINKAIYVVVTPFRLNLISVRCILWAQEYNCLQTKRMMNKSIESKKAIRFFNIISWHRWQKSDGPLTLNFNYMTEEYKKMAFGA